jgi:RimJ/RimL family protein N-acetyltransferase
LRTSKNLKSTMTIELRQIEARHICSDWLDTLNDPNYMQFSQNAGKVHTEQTQHSYISSFDTQKDQFAFRYLFGVFVQSELGGTLSVDADPKTQNVDIGILIFKRFSALGLGRSALGTVTQWCLYRYPGYSVRLGTQKQNTAMQKVAKACGYHEDTSLKNGNVNFVFSNRLQFPSDWDLPELFRDTSRPLLFYGDDVGGVEHLFEFFVRYEGAKRLCLSGASLEWAARRGITSFPLDTGDIDSSTGIIFSTGVNSAPAKKLLFLARRFQIPSVGILDHWTNFHRRFGDTRPDQVLVTNCLAAELAKRCFGEMSLIQSPDFKFEKLLNLRAIQPNVPSKHLLAVLEPKRHSAEGVDAINDETYQSLRKIIQEKMSSEDFDHGYIRPHPSYDSAAQLSSFLDLGLEVDDRIDIDWYLSCPGLVIGFSSVLLYYAKKLDVPVCSVLEENESTWRSHFGIPLVH